MAPPDKGIENQPFLDKFSDDFVRAEEPHQQYKPQSRRKAIKSYALVFVITSLLWMLLGLMTSPQTASWRSSSVTGDRHNVTSGAKMLTCGECSDEARQLGCKYDMLLNNWVPEPCYDEEFIQEYMDDNSYAAYADANLTQLLTDVEEMSDREYYYTSVRDHVNHCAMIWKKQFWVLFEERKAIDTMISNPSHTDHCALYLQGALGKPQSEATKVDVGYAGCWVRE
jgi:hypothetical protein